MMVVIKSMGYVALLTLFAVIASAHNKVVVVPLMDDVAKTDIADEKAIFVTRERFKGDLREKDEFGNVITGGLEGADAKCQAAADADGSLVQGKIFKAWLNDEDSTDRVFASGGRQLNLYTLPFVDSNGVEIFSEFTRFEDAEIAIIPVDQYGNSFENQGLTIVPSWAMGLDDTNGFVGSAFNCNNWTAEDGEFGQSATWFKNENLIEVVVKTGMGFNPNSGVTCGQPHNLTCLEQ